MLKGMLVLMLTAALATLSPKVKPVNLEQLQHDTQSKKNDTLYVLNFWATWCKPCVNELPFFENANSKFAGKKMKMILVSVNSSSDQQKVESFINEKAFKADVWMLSGNPNVWIDAIDPSWSGAIPATVMYRNGEKVLFHEGEYTQNELDSIIKIKIR